MHLTTTNYITHPYIHSLFTNYTIYVKCQFNKIYFIATAAADVSKPNASAATDPAAIASTAPAAATAAE